MFEVTIRTDDQLALHKLMEFLKSLNLQGFKAPVSNGKNSAVEVFVEPLREKMEHQTVPGAVAGDASVGATENRTGEVEFSKEYLELLKNYNPNVVTGRPSTAISLEEWAGIKPDPEKYKPGFGGAKGMFIMSDDFDEPLEDFKEYMY